MSSDLQNDKSATIMIGVKEFGFFLRFRVFIDNKNVGTLKSRNMIKAQRFQVQPGSHSVYVMIKDRKSEILEFDLKSGEKIALVAGYVLPSEIATLFGLRPILRVKKSWLNSGAILVQKVVEFGQTVKTKPENSFPEGKVESQSTRAVIHFKPEVQKVKAAIEEVNVPNGVTITVKRSRTFEHTLDIEQSELKGAGVKVGFEEILGLSIRGEIEKRRGRGYHQSETVEYEDQQ